MLNKRNLKIATTELYREKGNCILKKIRIVQLIHGIHFGGAEKIVYQICTRINRERFHPVCVILADGYLRKKLIEEGIETHLIPMRSKLDFTVISRIVKVLKQYKPTIIHCHTSRTNLIGRICSKLAKVKNVTTIHSPIEKDTNITLQFKPINAFIEKLSRPMLDMYVTVSKNVYDQFINEGFDKNKITYVPNGVEIEIAPISEEEKNRLSGELNIKNNIVVAMVSQLRPRKGCEYFIKAMPGIISKCKDVKFLIVGDAEFVEGRDYLGDLKKMTEDLKIADKVIFTGFREDVPKIMQLIDILVLPSLFGEGLPLTLLEGMANNIPIVATNTEGNNEVVIDGFNGFLVPHRNERAITEKICQLIDDKEMRIQMGKNGRKRVEEMFSINQMIRKYEEVYEGLIK